MCGTSAGALDLDAVFEACAAGARGDVEIPIFGLGQGRHGGRACDMIVSAIPHSSKEAGYSH